jgi:hypothetical protein
MERSGVAVSDRSSVLTGIPAGLMLPVRTA